MRPGNPNNRRQRGRQNRRPNRNQTFDSNGPGVRIRGNAAQIYDKYAALARDATSSGDRILAENLLQHAEHYFRIMNADNEAAAERRRRMSEEDGETDAQSAGPHPQAANQDGDQDSEDGVRDDEPEDAAGSDTSENEDAQPRRRRLGPGRRRRRPADADAQGGAEETGETDGQPDVAVAAD